MRGLFLSAALALLGCATPQTQVRPAPSGVTPAESWRAPLDRDHPLVGKIWDVQARAFVEPAAVFARAAKARFVLLGERHDNPDHHRLQARVVEGLLGAGRRPAVVFEMLELEQQPLIDSYLAQPGATAAGFGAALGWEKTSWPPFSEYQPIFEVAFAGKLAIKAGNIAQLDAKALVKQGLAALPEARAHELWLDRPFPAPLEAALVEELAASHCGMLPEHLLSPMALAQHARDAQLARVLGGSAVGDGAVLIAGGGHARLDRGVPYYLALGSSDARVVSVVFHEVRHADRDPQAYAGDEGPFDFVWFTPRESDDDPCAAFRR
jgi:uncharacterized iron-regulated protein